MKIAWVLYFMVGTGFSISTPYKDLPAMQNWAVWFGWPAVLVRDVINEFDAMHPKESKE